MQVAYLLGHGYTSGLSAMDAFLADDNARTTGAEALFSERIVRLSRIPLAYAPPAAMPSVSPLPAEANGFVTFGYFGRTERLNDAVIAAWSRIVCAVPRTRLVLDSLSFREAEFRDRVAARFAARDVPREQLKLICNRTASRARGQHRATSTSRSTRFRTTREPRRSRRCGKACRWSRSPVGPSVGRFGAMILHAVGLDDWVGGDVDAYVARAIAAAGDLGALARLRAELRPRFATSPLHDGAGLARAVEAAYRALWDEWRAVAAVVQAG